MYLGLFTGGGIGQRLSGVTVLFMEVAKRSFASLRRQEIYLLVYVATALVRGAFLDLLFRQYFVRSAEAEMFGISKYCLGGIFHLLIQKRLLSVFFTRIGCIRFCCL